MGFGDSLKSAFGFKKREVGYPIPLPPPPIMLTPPMPTRAIRRPMTAAERRRWERMNETLGERLKRESEKRSKYLKTLPIG
jgi:hypothetical protein